MATLPVTAYEDAAAGADWAKPAAAVRVRRVMEVCFIASSDLFKVWQNAIFFSDCDEIGE
jgi:hypothetical protein